MATERFGKVRESDELIQFENKTIRSPQPLSRPRGAGILRRVGWILSCALLLLLPNVTLFAQAQSGNAARQAKLAELNGQLRIGAEYFLNRTDTKASIDQAFQQMHATGLTLVRIFIIWDDIERVPGVWDFHRYDWIYDAAEKNGIQIAATLCPEDPPGWKDETPFYHNHTNLDDPAVRADAADYLRHVVGHYKNNPAQGIWLLLNEPHPYNTEPATFLAFGQWLRTKYGTVAELNRHWFRPLNKFSDAAISKEQLTTYWTDYQAVIDWRNFNVDNLVNELTWVKQQVEAIDPDHPTHFNVTEPTGDAHGQDVWKEKKVPDVLGVSMHAAWVFPPSTPESDYGELYSYRLDLIADASHAAPAKPFWVTELQSGPTVFTGGFPLYTTPGDLTRWMWDSYGAGSRAVIFWLWNPRTIGTEGGEWGLVSPDGTPSDRVPAVKSVAETLEKNPWLAKAKPQPAKVAILYNREADILISLDGRTQHRTGEVTQALMGCYLALHREHIPTDFVDLDQLKSGAVQKYSVLYIPYSYALDEQAIAALKTYVRDGGTLWADGLTGWKSGTGRVRATVPGGLTDVFGVEASDIYPVQADHPYSVTAQDEKGGELWRLPLKLKGAEVLLRDNEGDPFEVRHAFGKGHAYYFESAVALAYARRLNPIVEQWIAGISTPFQTSEPVSMTQGSREVLFRGMVRPAGAAAILTNWGQAQQVVVSFQGNDTVTDATGTGVPVSHQHGRTLATVNIPAGAVAILKAANTRE